MLTKDEVLNVAKLARLDLTEAEVEKFRLQLSNVLELFKKVDEIDLKDVETTSQVTGLDNVWKKDEIICKEALTCCTTEELLRGVPIKDGSAIKVPKVIGDSDA